MASVNVAYHPSEKLQSIYQPKEANFFQALDVQSKRIDTLEPVNKQQAQDSFILQQPQPYMSLKFKDRQVYKITAKDRTIAPTDTVVGTSPSIIADWAKCVDNGALSKQLSGLSIKWGGSTLESTRDDRNPWLYEVKSAQLDLEKCERYGLSPLALDGVGNLDRVMSSGTLSFADIQGITAHSKVPPLKDPNMVTMSEFAKKIDVMNSNVRVRIMDGSQPGDIVPVYTDLASPATPLTTVNNNANFFGQWIPTATTGGAVFYNATEGVQCVFYIEVIEYLMDDFLKTPYQKNELENCVQVTPASFVNFNFSYDTNYIQNGLYKFAAKSTTDASAVVERQPELHKLTVETFDITTPPQEGYSLKILAYRPTKVEAAQKQIANAGTASFDIIDQSDSVLPPYLLISADPQLYTGDQNSTLNAVKNIASYSTFTPANIEECTIQIGQSTITENISIDEMFKMSNDLMNNPKLAQWAQGKGHFVEYSVSALNNSSNYISRNRGCPFLLLDLGKLSLKSAKDCAQLLPNVNYGLPQTIRIKFKVRAQNISGTPSLYYYPHVYKFYPYIYSQVEGRAMEKNRIEVPYADAIDIITNLNTWHRDLSLDLTANGWYEDAMSYLWDNRGSLIRKGLKGIRVGRNVLQTGVDILNNAEKVAKHFGYTVDEPTAGSKGNQNQQQNQQQSRRSGAVTFK
jgi:hypothetical protein